MFYALFDSSGPVTSYTKVPFKGSFYYLKAVPVDSINLDSVIVFAPDPKVAFSGMRVFAYRDSLRNLLGNVNLRLLPTQEEIQRWKQEHH